MSNAKDILTFLLESLSFEELKILVVEKNHEITERASKEIKEKGKRPPWVRVARISNHGEVLLTFTNTMKFKSDLKDNLNSRGVTKSVNDT